MWMVYTINVQIIDPVQCNVTSTLKMSHKVAQINETSYKSKQREKTVARFCRCAVRLNCSERIKCHTVNGKFCFLLGSTIEQNPPVCIAILHNLLDLSMVCVNKQIHSHSHYSAANAKYSSCVPDLENWPIRSRLCAHPLLIKVYALL